LHFDPIKMLQGITIFTTIVEQFGDLCIFQYIFQTWENHKMDILGSFYVW